MDKVFQNLMIFIGILNKKFGVCWNNFTTFNISNYSLTKNVNIPLIKSHKPIKIPKITGLAIKVPTIM